MSRDHQIALNEIQHYVELAEYQEKSGDDLIRCLLTVNQIQAIKDALEAKVKETEQ